MKEIARTDGGWILSESESSEFWLSVHCGTVASFEVNMRLNFEERDSYLTSGIAAIEALAADVTSRPKAYWSRHVNRPAEADAADRAKPRSD